MNQSKPRLGVLALMLEGYEPLFPGFIEHQTRYVQTVLDSLAGTAEFVFPGPAGNLAEIEALTAVQICLLTIYDMCKAIDRGMRIDEVLLLHKAGGKSGEYRYQA